MACLCKGPPLIFGSSITSAMGAYSREYIYLALAYVCMRYKRKYDI